MAQPLGPAAMFGNGTMIEKRCSCSLLGLVLLTLGLIVTIPGAEAGLAAPSGPIILRVTGDIENTNQQSAAVFDRAMIESLGMETMVTETPWSEGEVTFEGIRGSRLLDALGQHGQRIMATAINDYTVEIPTEDLERNNLFFALKMNGRYLRVRDKGPIWAIYPFSAHPELEKPVFYNRSIWQLHQLEFN